MGNCSSAPDGGATGSAVTYAEVHVASNQRPASAGKLKAMPQAPGPPKAALSLGPNGFAKRFSTPPIKRGAIGQARSDLHAAGSAGASLPKHPKTESAKRIILDAIANNILFQASPPHSFCATCAARAISTSRVIPQRSSEDVLRAAWTCMQHAT